MLTINIWPLGNIFIILMKIQPLRFLVQPGSSEKLCLIYYVQVWVILLLPHYLWTSFLCYWSWPSSDPIWWHSHSRRQLHFISISFLRLQRGVNKWWKSWWYSIGGVYWYLVVDPTNYVWHWRSYLHSLCLWIFTSKYKNNDTTVIGYLDSYFEYFYCHDTPITVDPFDEFLGARGSPFSLVQVPSESTPFQVEFP